MAGFATGKKKPKAASAAKPRIRINQNMLIAIIGAGATLLAALLPSIIEAFKPVPEPTMTPIPATATFTHVPPTLTPTPIPPTSTPTIAIGIYDVFLSMDQAGEYKTEVFTPEQYIYVHYSLNDPSGLNNVKVIWYAVDVAGYKPNVVINQTDDKITRPNISLQVKTEPLWAVGKYKIELYLNSVLEDTLEFEVKK